MAQEEAPPPAEAVVEVPAETPAETPAEESTETLPEIPPAETVEEPVETPAETPTLELIPTTALQDEDLTDPSVIVDPDLSGETDQTGEDLDLGPEGVSGESAALKPQVSTDKSDYAPTETVLISGQNFLQGVTLSIKVTWPDGVVRNSAGDVGQTDSVVTDENGSFVYSYELRGEGQNGEYLVEVLNSSGEVEKSVTFTDGTGAIWTTDIACGSVNQNNYSSKLDVYLNGGPSGGGQGLPDGEYYVQVTEPDGALLGTSVGKTQDTVTVVGGLFAQCYNLYGLTEFADTTNPGGVYKVWVSMNSGFPNSDSKTDNFSVGEQGAEGVKICHRETPGEGPWHVLEVGEPSVDEHLGHGDFMYEGDDFDWQGAGNNPDWADLWCENNDPTPPDVPEYQCGETIYGINNQSDFSWIDSVTGEVHVFSSSAFGSSASADHPADARTYYLRRYDTNDTLAYYDHGADSHHTVGDLSGVSSFFTKLAFNASGELYGLTDDQHIYEIDYSVPSATDLGAVAGVSTGGDIVFDSNNDLYLIDTTGKLFLLTLGVSPVTASLQTNTSLSPVTGMAFANGKFYFSVGSGDSDIYSMGYDWNPVLLASDQSLVNDLSSCLAYEEPVCEEGIVWQIGDQEAGPLDNPVDELNYTGVFGVFPIFPDPFVIDTNSANEFPWNSNYSQSYATDFDVEFNYAGADAAAARLTIGWSPGRSASERKEVLLDSVSRGMTPVRLGTAVSGWWEQMERFEDTFDFALTHGDHVLTLKHLMGDGTLWDYVRLEIVSCDDQPPEPYCGDGQVGESEQCDGDEPQACQLDDGYAGIQSCVECQWGRCETEEYCGDGIVNGTEECDGQEGVGEGQSCTENCELESYSEVTVCKYDEMKNFLPGWKIALKGELHETINVPSDGSTVTSSSLLAGDYVLEPSGTYTYWPAQLPDAGIADAGYSLRPEGSYNPGPGAQWISGDDLGAYAGYLEVRVNNTNVDWGYLTQNHTYFLGLTHAGGSIAFNMLDSYYGDNSGMIPVEIYEGWVGVTGENGCVTFSDVPYGDYAVQEMLKAGWTQLNSPINPVTVHLPEERFAFMNELQTEPISGVKWEDMNGNGFRDIGDNGLSGWTINLWNGASVPDPALPADQTATTAPDGSYLFADLPLGDYTVCEEDRAGWEQTLPGGGTCYYLTLGGNNKPADDIDFGNYELGVIQGRKFEDLNQSGTRETGESFLDGWLVRLYNSDWQVINGMVTGDDTTEAGSVALGQYRFVNLSQGTYYTCEVMNPGWTQTAPVLGGARVANQSGAGDEGSVCWRSIFSQSGQRRTGRTFGNVQYGDITVCKYDDLDGDGERDDGEPGLPGVTLKLQTQGFLDALFTRVFDDSNGLVLSWQDVGEPVETGEDGCHTFEDLPAGSYRALEDLNDPTIAGYAPTDGFTTDEGDGYAYRVSDILRLAAGQALTVNFLNELQELVLTLAKTRTSADNVGPGSVVSYSITVTNEGDVPAYGVQIKEVLPAGFTYKAESTTGDAGEPVVNGQEIVWTVGTVPAGESRTVSFETDTDSGLGAYLYPGPAVAWGYNRPEDGQLTYTDFAVAWVQLVRSPSASTPLEPRTEEVLGAATGQVLGAATGADTRWLLLALGMILSGLLVHFRKRLRKIIGLSLIVGALVLAPAAKAANLSIWIADLPEYTKEEHLKISYSAVQKESQPIEVRCYLEKDGGFGWRQFDDLKTTVSGSCDTDNADFENDGEYRFKAVASSGGETVESNVSSVKLDRDGIDAPRDYGKSRESSTSYKIHWRAPDDEEFSFVRVYASKDRDFTADGGTSRGDYHSSKDQIMDQVVAGFDENVEYFFALQAFDKAGNGSSLVGDGPSVTTVTVEGTPVAGETVLAGGTSAGSSGQVLGGEATAGDDGEDKESAAGDEGEGGLIDGLAEALTGEKRGWFWLLGALAVGGIGYFFFFRKPSGK